MKRLHSVIYTFVLLASSFAVIFYIESGNEDSTLVGLIYSALFLIYCFHIYIFLERNFFNPAFLFVFSTAIFLFSRPFLYFFIGMEPIVATEPEPLFVLRATAMIGVIFSMVFLVFFSVTLDKLVTSVVGYDFRMQNFQWIAKVTLLISILAGFTFLYKSYLVSLNLGNLSYFENTNAKENYSHIWLFSICKLGFIFYSFLKGSYSSFRLSSLCLFFFSCGFFLIGLRGFPVLFLFLFLTFHSIRNSINLWKIFIIGLILCVVSALVLEFRLGFEVYDNFWEMLLLPLYQQGASFESVYGSVNFIVEVKRCINYLDFFFSQDVYFGNCVDRSQGIFFESGGGFGSSFFSEVYYLSGFGLGSICILGVALKFLSDAYDRAKRKTMDSRFNYLIIMACVPNVVYIARSSHSDATGKFVVVLSLCFIIILFIRKINAKV